MRPSFQGEWLSQSPNASLWKNPSPSHFFMPPEPVVWTKSIIECSSQIVDQGLLCPLASLSEHSNVPLTILVIGSSPTPTLAKFPQSKDSGVRALTTAQNRMQ